MTDEHPAPSPPPRILPALTDANRHFWTGGERGELILLRGAESGRWVHPPVEPRPEDGVLDPQPVSGRGTVFTFTVNHQQYHPDVPPPYVIAIVQLEEQDDLRLPTNIVGCDPDDVTIGMPVRVVFEQSGEHWVPLFEPDR